MILPSKYVHEQDAIIGISARILENLIHEKQLSQLWEDVKTGINDNFERFVLALDLLFMLGIIEMQRNIIIKVI